MRRLERQQVVRLCRKARHFRVSEPVIEGEQVRIEMSMRLKPSEFLDIDRTVVADDPRKALTPVMFRYALAYASGRPIKAIAADHGLSLKTIYDMLYRAKRRLRCQSVLHLARVFWEAGFLDESED